MGTLPGRVLVDLPNWLGDLVLAMPALERLVAGNRRGETWALAPEAHLPLLCLAGARPIARPARSGYAWARRRLRGQFDVVLTLRHSTRAKLLLAGTGARLRLASEGRGAAALGLSTFAVARSFHQRHDLDAALARLGLDAASDRPFVLALPSDLRRGGARQRTLLADGAPLVALLPGSRSAAKRYPWQSYAAVARRLAGCGVAAVVVVGPGEEWLAAELGARCGARVVPTTWPLDGTAGLLAACDAAVGNDSGLTHLAALVGCPTLALFGPTDARRTAPVGPARVLGWRVVTPRDGRVSLDPSTVAAAVVDLAGDRIRGAANGEPRDDVGAPLGPARPAAPRLRSGDWTDEVGPIAGDTPALAPPDRSRYHPARVGR